VSNSACLTKGKLVEPIVAMRAPGGVCQKATAMNVPNEEDCPVPLSFLSDLMRAQGVAAGSLINTLEHPLRARLALFCYRRAHLRQLAHAIASQCTREQLRDVGLIAGDALFLASRETLAHAARPKISLAGVRAA
jgi:hypothetical protein